MMTPIDVVVLKCHKICTTGNRRNRALFTSQKIWLHLARCYCVDRAQNLPAQQTFGSHYSRFNPNWFTFGRVIGDRVKAVLWAHWVNPRDTRDAEINTGS